jgi:thymus-specific serine protease
LLVMTEHRYYGESQPFGDLSTESLQYLTSEQSLADHAALHAMVSADYGLTSANKWVCFGGSYSGALSGWFRLKYPSLVVGAIASSAPVLAEVDYVQYLQVVTASLQTSSYGTQCTDRLNTATETIQQLLQTPTGLQQLTQEFNLCAAPANANDIANFIATVGGAFMVPCVPPLFGRVSRAHVCCEIPRVLCSTTRTTVRLKGR